MLKRAIALSYCATPGISRSIGCGSDISKSSYIKSFYMMGIGLTGKLSYTRTGLVCLRFKSFIQNNGFIFLYVKILSYDRMMFVLHVKW